MNCRHNHRDPSTIKYGAVSQRPLQCKACEEQAALQKSHDEMKAEMAALHEQVKQLKASIASLSYKIEMQKPLILR